MTSKRLTKVLLGCVVWGVGLVALLAGQEVLASALFGSAGALWTTF